MDMTFYTLPSDGPNVVMAEYGATFYDVREGWGCAEGWTNNYVATALTDEEMTWPAYDGIELSEEEVHESFSEEALEGIMDAVKSAAGR